MRPGDAIVFPHGDANLMSSPQMPVADAMTLSATPDRFPNTAIVNRGAGPEATFVCGFLGCDLRLFNPLLSALPRQIIAATWAKDYRVHSALIGSHVRCVANCRGAGDEPAAPLQVFHLASHSSAHVRTGQ